MMPDILDLELELQRGGWSLKTQREILEYFKGEFQGFTHSANMEEYKQWASSLRR